MNINKFSPSFSTKLDIARGAAASLVVLAHLRGGFFASYDHLTSESQNAINYILFLITRLGHEAVIIFFVLSGYLVGGAILTECLRGNPNWKKYMVNRITRMWTVLLPTLAIGAIFDYITLSFNAGIPGATHFTLNNFVGNMFFLQNIAVPTFGTNAPLWSLANEFWYYLLFPVILIIWGFKYHKILKCFVLISFFAGCYVVAPSIIKLFPIWIAGVGIRFIKDSYHFHNPSFMNFSYLFLLCSLGYSNIIGNTLSGYVLCFGVCIVIVGWQFGKESAIHPIFTKIAHFFSEFSFSLYAVHYFFMFWLFEVCKTFIGIPIRLTKAGIGQWAIFVCLVLIIYLWAFSFFWFTERHTSTIRKAVLRKVTKESGTLLLNKAKN